MQADFLDAHERHWGDAERLFQAQRWANADHLYGMAAECGMKRLMLAFGMPYDAGKDWPASKQDRAHAMAPGCVSKAIAAAMRMAWVMCCLPATPLAIGTCRIATPISPILMRRGHKGIRRVRKPFAT